MKGCFVRLSASKLGIGDRVFVLKQVSGASLFHKAVLNEISGWTMFTLDNSSVSVIKRHLSLHSNSLSAGFQFTIQGT